MRDRPPTGSMRAATFSAGLRRVWRRLWPIAFWLAVWQVASWAVGFEMLLASPRATLESLGGLVATGAFWASIATSLARILAGFAGAAVAGAVAAVLGSRFPVVRDLLAPLVRVVKTAPVASFVILVLIWVPSQALSVVISFLMVFPIIYTNLLEGIAQTDAALLEIADVFRLGGLRRIRYIYGPQVLPYAQAACSLALGLCWKAGIAAEVIGLPVRSIGEHLYEAKVYLNTPDLFAWTLVIIVISFVFEKVFGAGLRALARRAGAVWDARENAAPNGPAVEGAAPPAQGGPSAAGAGSREPGLWACDLRGPGLRDSDLRDSGLQALGAPAGPREVRAPRAAPIELRGVSKSYDGVTALDGLDLTIRPGSTTFIMGASGSGKTTLLRLLMGLEQPDAGVIEGLRDLRMTAVFQEDRLCEHLDAVANICLVQRRADAAGQSELRQRARAALAAVGMPDVARRPVRTLSGGMKRRVAILRAVLADGDLLLLDEPLKGLDEVTKHLVVQAVAPLVAGRTVVWVTHDPTETALVENPQVVRL